MMMVMKSRWLPAALYSRYETGTSYARDRHGKNGTEAARLDPHLLVFLRAESHGCVPGPVTDTIQYTHYVLSFTVRMRSKSKCAKSVYCI